MITTLKNRQRIHVIQGAYHVAKDPEVVLTTVLGSCVACCIRDPIAGVGGMNHFLLPDTHGGAASSGKDRIGVHLMELLLNDLFKRGAKRERLEAKIFGGGKVVEGLSDIGSQNAEFAERFLKLEEINFLGGDTGGNLGRRIEYWPISGRARQKFLSKVEISKQPKPAAPPPPPEHADAGEVELF